MIGRLGIADGRHMGVYREIVTAVECAAREMGLDPLRVDGPVAAAEAEIIIAVGYPGYSPWLADLRGPVRVAWLGEPLPPAAEPAVARWRRRLPMGRLVDAGIQIVTIGRRLPVPTVLTELRERAAYEHDQRLNLRDHLRAARSGIRLVVTSDDRQASLRRYGVETRVVPFGYHPILAGLPCQVDDAERDIDVLVLAAAASDLPTRRARLVARTVADLGSDLRVAVVEGGAWGEDRHRLLRRARVVLNVHRTPGNFTGIRSVLVGAAGGLLVSEPVDTPSPFVPGQHYIEAAAEELAPTTRSILDDRSRRLAMAGALQSFVVEELTMARALGSLLETPS